MFAFASSQASCAAVLPLEPFASGLDCAVSPFGRRSVAEFVGFVLVAALLRPASWFLGDAFGVVSSFRRFVDRCESMVGGICQLQRLTVHPTLQAVLGNVMCWWHGYSRIGEFDSSFPTRDKLS